MRLLVHAILSLLFIGLLATVGGAPNAEAVHRANVNRTEAPYNRRAGEAPALSDAEIDDLVAFLGTLTDADVAAAAH